MKHMPLPVDVWLVFGTYVYGFEGNIGALNGDILDVVICAGSEKDGAEVVQFFEEMAAHPRDLLKSEVRIYCDDARFNTLNFPIALFTDVVPLLVSPLGPRLRFSYLQGVSPADNEGWQKFLAEAC